MDALNGLLLKVETAIEPISSMTEQVKIGERNLFACQEYVRGLIELTSEVKDTSDFLNKRLLNVEFELYLKMLKKAQDLRGQVAEDRAIPRRH